MTAVASFYRFCHVPAPLALREHLRERCRVHRLRGTIILAHEGINGMLAGAQGRLERFAVELRRHPPLAGLRIHYARAGPDNPVFDRLKLRVKPEIVSLGRPDLTPEHHRSTHLDAAAWNDVLDDPGVMVVDTRNRFEIGMGSFPRAVDPGTRAFREFPERVPALLERAGRRPIAMFCTGGVRCEKASACLLAMGASEVYQLDGGILRYLDTTPSNRWQGACFVFDQRIAVGADQPPLTRSSAASIAGQAVSRISG